MREVFNQQMNEMKQGWKTLSRAKRLCAVYSSASIATLMIVGDNTELTTLAIVGANAAACLLWIIRNQIRNQNK